MSLAPTTRRHFRQKVWPHEKTEPLSLPLEAWAFTWYRYFPASNVPLQESLCDMSLAPTFRRHFRRKFWRYENTEPLLLPFKAWAFIWYRHCPASSVPLREKCTESLCDMSLARTFRRHFRRKLWPHEKTEPLLLPFERWALTWYRYCPASTVSLREKCTEKWCP